MLHHPRFLVFTAVAPQSDSFINQMVAKQRNGNWL